MVVSAIGIVEATVATVVMATEVVVVVVVVVAVGVSVGAISRLAYQTKVGSTTSPTGLCLCHSLASGDIDPFPCP